MEYFLNPFYLICIYLFKLIALYPFNLIRIYSFNSIRKKYLFHLGDWVKPRDQKDMGLGTIAFHVQRSSAITRNTCSAKRQ